MANYWLTFRLEDDANYGDRYDGLIKAVNLLGTGFWSEPTSFIVMESISTIDTIAAALKAELNSTTDILVIREIGRDSTRYIGEPSEGFVYFFPKAKQV